MSTLKKHRTQQPALSEWRNRGRLTLLFLQCYADDQQFRQDLSDLATETNEDACVLTEAFAAQDKRERYWHWIASEVHRGNEIAMRHDGKIKAFATRNQLHRLPRGTELIGEWLHRRCQRPQAYPPERFYRGTIGFGGAMGYVWPEIQVNITDFWRIEEETQAEALERIVKICADDIGENLARLRVSAEKAGYIFPSVQPTEEKSTSIGYIAVWFVKIPSPRSQGRKMG